MERVCFLSTAGSWRIEDAAIQARGCMMPALSGSFHPSALGPLWSICKKGTNHEGRAEGQHQLQGTWWKHSVFGGSEHLSLFQLKPGHITVHGIVSRQPVLFKATLQIVGPAKQEKQTDIHSKYLRSEWIYKYQTSVYSHFLIFTHICNVNTIHMCSLLVQVEKIQFFLRICSLCQYNSIDSAYWNYWC